MARSVTEKNKKILLDLEKLLGEDILKHKSLDNFVKTVLDEIADVWRERRSQALETVMTALNDDTVSVIKDFAGGYGEQELFDRPFPAVVIRNIHDALREVRGSIGITEAGQRVSKWVREAEKSIWDRLLGTMRESPERKFIAYGVFWVGGATVQKSIYRKVSLPEVKDWYGTKAREVIDEAPFRLQRAFEDAGYLVGMDAACGLIVSVDMA